MSYLGTAYCGWQRQKPQTSNHLPSIQQTVEEALVQITKESPAIVASGRTDAGVHALEQVAHFSLLRTDWVAENIRRGLNSLLPKDIRIHTIESVGESFHAQKSAVKKQYSYYLQQGPSEVAHLVPVSWWIRRPLDLHRMREALKTIEGEHDFRPFQAAGGVTRTTVRTIFRASLSEKQEALALPGASLIQVSLMGSGFLKQMVRGIVGTLVEIGEGKSDPSLFRTIIARQNRSLLGPTAAARGLWLDRVFYGSRPESESIVDSTPHLD